MPNTLNPTNPNIITLDDKVDVWQYQGTPELDQDNPAVEARAEHLQHQYVEALARPDDDLSAPEIAQPYAEVPAADHTDTVVAEAQAVVANAFAADPDMLAMHQANEVQRLNREHHAEALRRAAAYAPRVDAMRDRALLDWGANDQAQGE